MITDPRTELEQKLTISAENITSGMLVRTPEVNIALIISVAQNYAKMLIELNNKIEEADNGEKAV
jgi:hypothetical protein